MYACICHAVTSDELDAVIAGGAHDCESVGEACGAGTGCGSCLDRVADRCAAFRRGRLEVVLGGSQDGAPGPGRWAAAPATAAGAGPSAGLAALVRR